MNKEIYQEPAIEEMDSTLIVQGLDECVSGIDPDPTPDL
jgi:hypothetical protein